MHANPDARIAAVGVGISKTLFVMSAPGEIHQVIGTATSAGEVQADSTLHDAPRSRIQSRSTRLFDKTLFFATAIGVLTFTV
ncbi:hypothetical protein BLA9940_04485 [Burkholderia aenigmatica]|nr:hypothetical protein BLA9940_04485 [Burkholderia aenigmatica]